MLDGMFDDTAMCDFFHFREKKPRQQSGDHENLMNVVSPCAHVCVCFHTSAAYLSTVPTSCQAEGNRGREPSQSVLAA